MILCMHLIRCKILQNPNFLTCDAVVLSSVCSQTSAGDPVSSSLKQKKHAHTQRGANKQMQRTKWAESIASGMPQKQYFTAVKESRSSAQIRHWPWSASHHCYIQQAQYEIEYSTYFFHRIQNLSLHQWSCIEASMFEGFSTDNNPRLPFLFEG